MVSMNFPTVSADSLRAFATEIRNEMSGGFAVDDSRFSLRHIEADIRHTHGLVQKEIDDDNLRKGILPDEARYRIFKCLKLKDTDDFYCKCTDSGGSFKKVVIPPLYKWRGRSFMTYFGNTSMSINFTPANNVFQVNSFPELTSRPAFFMVDTNAYVALPEEFALVCEVTVIAIPANPNETNGKCFNPWTPAWNVDEYVKAMIKARVKDNLARLMLQTAQDPDIRNNAQSGNQVTSILAQ